jgi:murein DD-endopeptidase MepM/ murein hydrolase activator NlpD
VRQGEVVALVGDDGRTSSGPQELMSSISASAAA